MAYPPEPWDLKGQLVLSAWLAPYTVPADDRPSGNPPPGQSPPDDLSPGDPPPGIRPVVIGGRCLTICAWLRYERGGVLEYDEFLSAVLVRRGARPMAWITHIWVDSPVSRDGGRELWGLPKQLAVFDPHAGDRYGAVEHPDGPPIVSARLRRLVGLPGRWPVSYHVVQTLGGEAKVSAVRFKGRFELLRSRWTFAPEGQLAHLAHLARRRPLLSLALRDFDLIFGSPPEAAPQSGTQFPKSA